MERDYQYAYSEQQPAVFNTAKLTRKAETILRVCRDFLATDDLSGLDVLDVGSSSGIIDNHLAQACGYVLGLDIDNGAVSHARSNFARPNLDFRQGDAMQLPVEDASFDVVVCTQIYEHVPDAATMFREIHRVLKPGGFCYFSGNNRMMLFEPHYRLPLLSWLPRPLAHKYLQITGKADHYHELHFTWWTLRRLCAEFEITDYTARVTADPERFGVDYMVPRGSAKWWAANTVTHLGKWLAPMIWLLQKPAVQPPG